MPKEVWYLMGAWFLGATMNAMMTWWAVSLTLLNHQFGNEVLGREQLLKIVPIFVAVLVWLTRILFIGAFSVAGERLFRFGNRSEPVTPRRSSPPTSRRTKAKPNTATKRKPAARRAAPRKSPARRPPPPVSLPEVVYVSEEEEEEEFEEMVPGQPTRVAPRPVINPPKAPRPVPNHNRSRNQRHQPVSAPRPRPAPAPRPSRNASRVRQRPPKPVTRRGPISARSTTRGPLG